MAEQKTKIRLPDGRQIEGIDLKFENSGDPTVELTVEDGALIRVKFFILSVIAIPGEKDPDGNPLYAVKSGNALTVVQPPA
jgi:hypothetical protein